jgi:hypothetical protein
MTNNRLLALSNTHFVLVALVLLILAIVCGLVLFFPNTIFNLQCEHFDLPGYSASFGFTLGEMEAPDDRGGAYTVRAIIRLDPDGALARSGARVGDVPRMHHGIAEFCGALASASQGEAVHLRVYNLDDAKSGKDPWRELVIRKK